MKTIHIIGDEGVGKRTLIKTMESEPFKLKIGMDEINNADVIIIMFAVNNLESYQNINYWYSQIPKSKLLLLVGNKADLSKHTIHPLYIIEHLRWKCKFFYVSSGNIQSIINYINESTN